MWKPVGNIPHVASHECQAKAESSCYEELKIAESIKFTRFGHCTIKYVLFNSFDVFSITLKYRKPISTSHTKHFFQRFY